MRILFLPKHEYLGASSRYRTLQYLPYLKSKGIDITVSPLFTDQYLRYKYYRGKENKILTLQRLIKRIKTIVFTASSYDVLVIEKELLPYFPPILEKFLKNRKIPYIVDYDDAVWHNYDQHKSFLIRKFLGYKINKVLQNAETVIGGSEYIIEFALKLRLDNVYKIPTVIDIRKYQDQVTSVDPKFVVGWIGSPSSSSYITIVNDALETFAKKLDVEIRLIGFDEALQKSLQFPYKVIKWTEDTEVAEIQKFDVGIMPLPDTPFERGKCGFKLIQYMGCKKPVIASPVNENTVIVEHGINGFLADSTEQWLQFMEQLYVGRKFSQRLGMNGYNKVKENYSLQQTQKRYFEIIKKTVSA